MTSEKFCLRWNDFETNISDAFRELRKDKDFFDVTLACENEQIQAHKVILSACSSFFRNILRRNVHQHPLVYLKGVKFGDLQSVLNFMYQGEVSVAQEELNSFLAVAEDLKVKGLTQDHSESQKIRHEREAPNTKTVSYAKVPLINPPKESRLPLSKRQKPIQATPNMSNTYSSVVTSNTSAAADDDIQEVVPVKSEPGDLSAHTSEPAQDIFSPGQTSQAITTAEDTLDYQEDNYEEYEQYQQQQYQGAEGTIDGEQMKGYMFQDPSELLQFVQKDPSDPLYHCVLCTKFSHKTSYCVRNHVEAQHFPNMFVYPCDQCDLTFSTKSNFTMHRSRKHKKKEF